MRQHRTDQKRMGLLKGQCVESRKGHLRYCCNQVWKKNGGRIPWSVTAICEKFKISCQMGRHPVKGGSAYHLMARLSRLEQWWNITQFLQKTCRDCINSVLKSCQVYSLDMRCTRGEHVKEDIMVADIEESEQMDASETYAKRLNAKELLTLVSVKSSHSQSQMER